MHQAFDISHTTKNPLNFIWPTNSLKISKSKNKGNKSRNIKSVIYDPSLTQKGEPGGKSEWFLDSLHKVFYHLRTYFMALNATDMEIVRGSYYMV